MKMKTKYLTTFVIVLLTVTFWGTAQENGKKPVTVSPGSETEMVTVWQSCPTFSWSSIDQAASYRIAVFESVDGKLAPYEGMVAISSPVISKQIPGPALSWTISSEESLKSGSMYIWYVQAVDAAGNAIGPWSNGRIFQVEQEVRFAGIEEKLGEILKSYGVNDETTANVLTELKSRVKEVVVRGAGIKNSPEVGGIQGTEGPNTYYGVGAGASNTTGYWNTFIGFDAGNANTTGYQNTFLGDAAGAYNTTGYQNTFTGMYAGVHNTTGHNNIFVGFSAGYSNTSGFTNAFFGGFAGYNNTTGEANSFFGNETGKFNTTGYDNNFLGAQAGYNNSTGYSNNFIGSAAGLNNTTGYYNNFLGKFAGGRNTTGNNNTYLGNSTGFNNISGSGNVFLGFGAGYNETNSNKLYIANSDTSSPLIYGEFDNSIVTVNGKLGVGTKTPAYPIELKTTGQNATFTTTRTDGAKNFMNATASYAQFGAVSNHPVRLLVNSAWKMMLNIDGSLSMASGASCTVGGIWTNASSRALKENIENLSAGEAVAALTKLNPVKYNYKVDKTDKCVGFIAEDVPDLVATNDRKGLNSMDITAVLTKVVQEQQSLLQEYRKLISDLQERVATLEKK